MADDRERAGPEGESPDSDRVPAKTSRTAGIGRWILGLMVLAAIVAVVLTALDILPGAPRLSESEIRERAATAVQREAREAFLVTGRLDVTATTRVENTKRLLPGTLDLDLGTTSARVRVPGRILYGVDVSGLSGGDFEVVGDSVLEVRLPEPVVAAVEPTLSEMEVETQVGWARLQSRSGREAEHRAIRMIEGALRQQGEAHVGDSRQPVVNTAETVAELLRPVLREAGMRAAAVRVRIGSMVVRVGAG